MAVDLIKMLYAYCILKIFFEPEVYKPLRCSAFKEKHGVMFFHMKSSLHIMSVGDFSEIKLR